MPLNAFDWRNPEFVTSDVFRGCSAAISASDVTTVQIKSANRAGSSFCMDELKFY